MSDVLFLSQHPTKKVDCSIHPPSSKSESNRSLIINALSGFACELENLSSARDTQTMITLLDSDDYMLDVIDAGTTMRFLTAYCAIIGREAELTGTARMCERPIKLLVDALKELGCNIKYKNIEGYPPLIIDDFDRDEISVKELSIKGDVSSQYITALLMIAPTLPNGLTLKLEGKVGSRPYIEMTLSLMKHFGVSSEADWNNNIITIAKQEYAPTKYFVESDWSGASYWFSVVALAEEAKIELIGYKEDSLQGDKVICDIAKHLGVKSTFTEKGLLLEKSEASSSFKWDFTHCPDLAQTVAVICAAKGISCEMSGLESLRIKETDRIAAIQNELQKFGGDLIEIEKDNKYVVTFNNFKVAGQHVKTYKDHRMAMAFAPLALLGEVEVESPKVVDKSYPSYWEDLNIAGFEFKK